MKLKNYSMLTSILTLGLATYIAYDNYQISVSEIVVKSNKVPKNFVNFKILQLSDLHCKEFGNNNIRLIKKINKINPDIIIATGDMFSTSLDVNESFYKLCNELVNKYPIYYSLGNHETILRVSKLSDRIWIEDYLKKIKKLGVCLLDNEMVSIDRGNEKINIYGLTLPMMFYRRRFNSDRDEKIELKSEFIENLIGKPNLKEFNVLLAHNPLNFEAYANWGSDLIFSGHVHGGAIRLPFVGGLLSPEISFLPKYKEGFYIKNNSIMIVNRGLGNSSMPIRILNGPEMILTILSN